MHPLIAQSDPAQICAQDDVQDWLCTRVLEATGSEVLAQLSKIAGVLGSVLLVVLVAFALTRLARAAIRRFSSRMEASIQQRLARAVARGALDMSARYRTRRLQRLQSITGVLRGAVAVVIWTTAVLIVLTQFGVPLQPILAGAGLFGIVVGFGAQQLVRDVLAGIAMLIEDQYGVGDWIEVDDRIGQVERVGLRSTAFRDVDGVVHHVLNGYVQRVGNLSQEWARATLDVQIALDADIPAAKALIYKVADDLVNDELYGQDVIGPAELWGVQSIGPEGVSIRVVVPTKPLRNWEVTRQLRERVKASLDQARIRMPSQLIDIGGQALSHPVLTRDLADERTHETPRRQGVFRPGDGRGERPTPPPATAVPAGDEEEADEADATRDLRLERGPEPRPD